MSTINLIQYLIAQVLFVSNIRLLAPTFAYNLDVVRLLLGCILYRGGVSGHTLR
jgi:hypothetical protein